VRACSSGVEHLPFKQRVGGSSPPTLTHFSPGWWNWQTHHLEGVAPVRACEFKSRSGHNAKGWRIVIPFCFTSDALHFRSNPRTLATVMTVRAHLLVSGIVQGVGFRFFAYNHATNFNLTGYVRNLPSGQVELEVEGDRSLVEAFIKEVRVGSRSSHITDVKIEWIKCTNSNSSFEVR
jgi:acylphosphatase